MKQDNSNMDNQTENIDDFKQKVTDVVRSYLSKDAFPDKKVTDTPTDALQVANKKYVDSLVVSPGGSDKNIQYDNNGVFGGITNNSSTIAMYLNQTSAGTPNWQQVADSQLLMHDVTTNDVGTSNHGFAPKGNGDTSKFLNANGSYGTSYGAVTSVFQKNVSNASTDETLTHGLGRIPKLIKLSALEYGGTAGLSIESFGSYDGSNSMSIYKDEATTVSFDAANVIHIVDTGGNGQQATLASITSSQYMIRWTKVGASVSRNMNVLSEISG